MLELWGDVEMAWRETLGISSIYQNGTTHIPVAVRKRLEVKDGDKILWVMEEGRIVLEPARQRSPVKARYTVLAGHGR